MLRAARSLIYSTITGMTSALTIQFNSVRTRVVDGKTLIGLKHTAKDVEGAARLERLR